ncbi:hypothetical transmembrane anchored protein [Stenotrophomonas maltophilia K279a]|uniref:Hypothetical transmembrane anchored protein n=2 Tax=Stenotrophomonas maltophilia TaxID=40324 RepID=B2FM74_STRMK|nr:hypothetical transmembrane anchored protein [Stenotrophomonas maltophilia K279a]
MVEHMSALSSSLYLALGIATATGIGATFSTSSPSTDEPGQAVRAPAALVITSPRICAALEVYTLASENDWGLRTTIAQAVLNGFNDAGRVPDCAAGVSAALAKDFSPYRWQLALDAVDAVVAGTYSVSPDACARANTVVPLSTEATSSVVARARCVIYDLAFVEVH